MLHQISLCERPLSICYTGAAISYCLAGTAQSCKQPELIRACDQENHGIARKSSRDGAQATFAGLGYQWGEDQSLSEELAQ